MPTNYKIFSDVLQDRIKRLNECFARAIADYGYPGVYRGVFPTKVNQQKHLIDEVVEFGAPYHYGLEAGSKPELLIALSALNDPNGLIICNGYKDHKYIETALLAQRFGKTVIVVLERIEELDFALQAAERTGIRPTLGIRANADLPDQAELAYNFGARGIGLCRTEHMFFGEGRIPVVQRMILANNEADRRAALDELLPFQRDDFYGCQL